ncbi:MAG: TasA family protein [Dethiobacteria bacterium]|jgi:predicted ribosomally synthesized peptide with SipW-like signal peptide
MSKKVMLVALSIALVAALVGGATMAWFTDSDVSGPVEFAAGTLLVEANTSMIYGVEYKDPENQPGTLYEIFVDKDSNIVTYTKLYDSNKKRLNALAFDRKNKKLYYADGNSNLYFYDFTDGVGDKSAGKIFEENTKLYNAVFGLGYYWFVKEGTDDLYKVSFNPDGTIDDVILAHENFTGEAEMQFGFGDLALDMKDGIIYGSTAGTGSSGGEFFTYNVATGEYEEVLGADAVNLQLAFGADGELYGTVTRDLEWYAVDVSSGDIERFYECDKMFGDLASNYQNNWNPGDSDILRYYVRNKGTKNQYVRVSVSGEWLEDLSSENVSFLLCGGVGNDWEYNNGYFYYKHILEPGQEALLCVQVHLDGPGTDNDYKGQAFTVNAGVEAIQTTHDASQEVWSWSPSE